MKKLIVIAILLGSLVSCTSNKRVKTWGGKETITLPVGQKLVNVTWKDTQIWYLTEPMPEGYVPSPKTFREISSMGIFEGEITFIESK